MPSNSKEDLQARRQQILTALTITPLDAEQIRKLSITFAVPFTGEEYVRRVMDKLHNDKLVVEHTFPSSRKYWKLAKLGYQQVYGPDKPLPSPKTYRPISPSLERHTRRLADLIVKIQVTAHLSDIEIVFIYGDGQASFTSGGVTKIPDAMIGFRLRGRKQIYTIVFELDCGTEPVFSPQARDSLDKTIAFYLQHESSFDGSYRVAMLFDKPSIRLDHFLDRVAEINTDPRRRVIKAGLLNNVLKHGDPLRWPLLLDWDRQLAAMLPGNKAAAQTIPSPLLDAQLVA